MDIVRKAYHELFREFLANALPKTIPIDSSGDYGKRFRHSLLLVCLASLSAIGQPVLVWPDSVLTLTLPDIVVTGTRTTRKRADVPIPITVISHQEVVNQGALRVSDLLSEQTGLQLVHGIGTGIQVQGLDAAYTLILLDGQPLIGRNAGTLDLERIPVGDLERVEIVQGPSSSLYGSEALAGVINLISRTPEPGMLAKARLRYETHNTADVTTSADWSNGKSDGSILLNRYSSGGYDLSPDVVGVTSPGFVDYNARMRLSTAIDSITTASVGVRFASQDQESTTGVLLDGMLLEYDERAQRLDWSIAPEFDRRLGPLTKFKIRSYVTGHRTDWFLRDLGAHGGLEGETFFDHLYATSDAQFDAVIGRRHYFVAGTGATVERVKADRVRGDRRLGTNVFGFLQHEWWPDKSVDIIGSARFDWHSDYAPRLSPKLAVLYRPTTAIRIRGSLGSGFKAPTFQQLYMDFTNPVAGYTVLGAVDAAEALAELDERGQIQAILTDASTIGDMRPETSLSYSVGAVFEKRDSGEISLSVFRNNVRDLIETLPIAAKANGQQVFSYVNLNRIRTEGFQIDARFQPTNTVTLHTGYQYLRTADRDVLEEIDEGVMFKRVGTRDVRISRSDYGGLFGRSSHGGSLKLIYSHAATDIAASIRGLFRSRYGYGDLNGNLILDDDSEYVPGYILWHATLTKPLGRKALVQTGVRNIFDYTDVERIPSLPGRRWFASLQFEFQ